MSDIQLFMVVEDGLRPLPIPQNATAFYQLYDGLPVGVYSALRTYEQNKFLWLDDHIQRMVRSLNLLGWQYKLDEGKLRRGLHEAATKFPFPEARVRFDLLAEPLHHEGYESRILIAMMPFAGIPPHYYAEGVKVDFAASLQRETPLAKTADFAVVRGSLANDKDVYEHLLVDPAGHILEGTGSNFIGVQSGTVYTAAKGVLEGVTLKMILSLLDDLNIPLSLQPVHVEQIASLDEAGLCSSSRALIPIVQIGEAVVGNGRPGPICQRILTAYRDYVRGDVKTAV